MQKQENIGIQSPQVKEPISETLKKVGYLVAGAVLGIVGYKVAGKK